MLNAQDFAWNAQQAAWQRQMQDLKTFRLQVGHCHVPLNHATFPKLGLWVKEQRRHYSLMKLSKSSHMTLERKAELDEIEFCWDTHEATWLERLRELQEYRSKEGHVIVPTTYPQNLKLGTWVHHQRRQYKKFIEKQPCHITQERIQALESLGFVWYPRDNKGGGSSSGASLCSDDNTERRDVSHLDLRPRKRQRTV
jgi:hypothetical protein